MTAAFSAAILFVILIVAAIFVSRKRFDRRIDREVAALFDKSESSKVGRTAGIHIDSLPPPVQRYIKYALDQTRTTVTSVRLLHSGHFRLKPDQKFFPIKGEQYYATEPPGFVWHAKISVAPLIWMEARDHYQSGRAGFLGKLWSTFTLVDKHDEPEVTRASLLRWLAEAPWFPQVFLDDRHIKWSPVDEYTAKVETVDDNLSVSAIVRINDEGQLTSLEAHDRGRDVGKKIVPTPWVARFTDYRDASGVNIPFVGEVSWKLPDGDFTYARFSIDRIEYDIGARFGAAEPSESEPYIRYVATCK